MLQALESRVLFSAALVNGELLVEGTSSADVIVVQYQALTSSIIVQVNDDRASFTRSDVQHITVSGKNGSDRIDGSTSPISMELHGGSGNDTLFGGTAGDRLFGSAGNDKLTGHPGADALDGGPGNDYLDGGKANDTLKGSAGNDQLLGGDGSDSLSGGSGDDNLSAGLFAPDTGGQRPETLLGGDGNDQLNAVNNCCGDEIDGGDGHDFAYYESPLGSGNAVTGRRDLIFSVEKSVAYGV